MSIEQDIAVFNVKLDAALKSIMENEVFVLARDAIIASVFSEVYGKYEPSEYQRRYDSGGLADPNNIVMVESQATADGYEIAVQNQTRDDYDHRLIAPIVESGEGYEWEQSRIYKMQPYPRPFHEKAEEMIGDGLLDNALERGFRARGF